MAPSVYDISLHPRAFSHKPTLSQIGKVSKQIAMHIHSLTLSELCSAISNGQTWTPATFLNGCRDRHHFMQQQLLAVDLDHGNCSEQSLLKLWKQPNILHESFSSTQQNKKWRLVFALDEPMQLPEEVVLAAKYLANVYASDSSIAEPARLLYGTNKQAKLLHATELSTNALLDEAASWLAQQKSHKAEQAELSVNMAGELLSLEALQARLDRMPKEVRTLHSWVVQDVQSWLANPDIKGSGYQSLFRSAVHLSLLHYIPDELIKQILLDELARHDHFDENVWQHANKAESIIDKAIAWGRKLPPRVGVQQLQMPSLH